MAEKSKNRTPTDTGIDLKGIASFLLGDPNDPMSYLRLGPFPVGPFLKKAEAAQNKFNKGQTSQRVGSQSGDASEEAFGSKLIDEANEDMAALRRELGLLDDAEFMKSIQGQTEPNKRLLMNLKYGDNPPPKTDPNTPLVENPDFIKRLQELNEQNRRKK